MIQGGWGFTADQFWRTIYTRGLFSFFNRIGSLMDGQIECFIFLQTSISSKSCFFIISVFTMKFSGLHFLQHFNRNHSANPTFSWNLILHSKNTPKIYFSPSRYWVGDLIALGHKRTTKINIATEFYSFNYRSSANPCLFIISVFVDHEVLRTSKF